MLIRRPNLDAEQIAKWLQQGATTFAPTSDIGGRGSTWEASRPNTIDFKKVRDALRRARTKTDIKTVKPLRRLRTNQGAINESLVDAITALLATNKEMATELNALAAELAQLRSQLARQDDKQ